MQEVVVPCISVEHTRALVSEASWGQRTALLLDTSSCVLEVRSTSGSTLGAWAAKRCHSSAQLLRKSVGGAWQGDVDCSSIPIVTDMGPSCNGYT